MTKPVNLHDGTGVIITVPVLGHMLCHGPTVPPDGSVGYAQGCKFIKTSGSVTANTVWYVNIGTSASSNFDAALLA